MNRDSVSEPPVKVLSRRERDRHQRREDIFRAAEAVFAEKGYHAASIEEIARTAEYGTGTVYLYFKDKEALYVEMFEEKVRALFEYVKNNVEQEKDTLHALRRLIRARMEYFDRNRAFFEIYMHERMDKWDGVHKLYEQYIDLLTRLIKDGQRQGRIRKGDSRQFAVALSGMMMQLTRDWLKQETSRPLMSSIEFIVELFLRGAEVKG